MKRTQTPYILAEGKNANKRLDFQHKLFSGKLIEAFETASSMINISGATVVDFGCGTSSAYKDISTFIGCSGKYIGIDSSKEQISFNQSKYKAAYYLVGDENSPQVMAALTSADIIYLRFVVMHQKNQNEFVKKIYNTAKSKAILIIQEPENTPEHKAEMVKKYPFSGDLCDIKSKIGKRVDLNYNFAKDIEPVLKDLNPETIIHRSENIQIPLPQVKKLFTPERPLKEIHFRPLKLIH